MPNSKNKNNLDLKFSIVSEQNMLDAKKRFSQTSRVDSLLSSSDIHDAVISTTEKQRIKKQAYDLAAKNPLIESLQHSYDPDSLRMIGYDPSSSTTETSFAEFLVKKYGNLSPLSYESNLDRDINEEIYRIKKTTTPYKIQEGRWSSSYADRLGTTSNLSIDALSEKAVNYEALITEADKKVSDIENLLKSTKDEPSRKKLKSELKKAKSDARLYRSQANSISVDISAKKNRDYFSSIENQIQSARENIYNLEHQLQESKNSQDIINIEREIKRNKDKVSKLQRSTKKIIEERFAADEVSRKIRNYDTRINRARVDLELKREMLSDLRSKGIFDGEEVIQLEKQILARESIIKRLFDEKIMIYRDYGFPEQDIDLAMQNMFEHYKDTSGKQTSLMLGREKLAEAQRVIRRSSSTEKAKYRLAQNASTIQEMFDKEGNPLTRIVNKELQVSLTDKQRAEELVGQWVRFGNERIPYKVSKVTTSGDHSNIILENLISGQAHAGQGSFYLKASKQQLKSMIEVARSMDSDISEQLISTLKSTDPILAMSQSEVSEIAKSIAKSVNVSLGDGSKRKLMLDDYILQNATEYLPRLKSIGGEIGGKIPRIAKSTLESQFGYLLDDEYLLKKGLEIGDISGIFSQAYLETLHQIPGEIEIKDIESFIQKNISSNVRAILSQDSTISQDVLRREASIVLEHMAARELPQTQESYLRFLKLLDKNVDADELGILKSLIKSDARDQLDAFNAASGMFDQVSLQGQAEFLADAWESSRESDVMDYILHKATEGTDFTLHSGSRFLTPEEYVDTREDFVNKLTDLIGSLDHEDPRREKILSRVRRLSEDSLSMDYAVSLFQEEKLRAQRELVGDIVDSQKGHKIRITGSDVAPLQEIINKLETPGQANILYEDDAGQTLVWANKEGKIFSHATGLELSPRQDFSGVLPVELSGSLIPLADDYHPVHGFLKAPGSERARQGIPILRSLDINEYFLSKQGVNVGSIYQDVEYVRSHPGTVLHAFDIETSGLLDQMQKAGMEKYFHPAEFGYVGYKSTAEGTITRIGKSEAESLGQHVVDYKRTYVKPSQEIIDLVQDMGDRLDLFDLDAVSSSSFNKLSPELQKSSIELNILRNYAKYSDPRYADKHYFPGITELHRDATSGLQFLSKQGVSLEDAISEQQKILQSGDFVIAHNAFGAESPWVEHFSNKVGLKTKGYNYIDTRALSQLVYPEERSHNLEAVAQREGVSLKQAHRTVIAKGNQYTGDFSILEGDVPATGEIASSLINKLSMEAVEDGYLQAGDVLLQTSGGARKAWKISGHIDPSVDKVGGAGIYLEDLHSDARRIIYGRDWGNVSRKISSGYMYVSESDVDAISAGIFEDRARREVERIFDRLNSPVSQAIIEGEETTALDYMAKEQADYIRKWLSTEDAKIHGRFIKDLDYLTAQGTIDEEKARGLLRAYKYRLDKELSFSETPTRFVDNLLDAHIPIDIEGARRKTVGVLSVNQTHSHLLDIARDLEKTQGISFSDALINVQSQLVEQGIVPEEVAQAGELNIFQAAQSLNEYGRKMVENQELTSRNILDPILSGKDYSSALSIQDDLLLSMVDRQGEGVESLASSTLLSDYIKSHQRYSQFYGKDVSDLLEILKAGGEDARDAGKLLTETAYRSQNPDSKLASAARELLNLDSDDLGETIFSHHWSNKYQDFAGKKFKEISRSQLDTIARSTYGPDDELKARISQYLDDSYVPIAGMSPTEGAPMVGGRPMFTMPQTIRTSGKAIGRKLALAAGVGLALYAGSMVVRKPLMDQDEEERQEEPVPTVMPQGMQLNVRARNNKNVSNDAISNVLQQFAQEDVQSGDVNISLNMKDETRQIDRDFISDLFVKTIK